MKKPRVSLSLRFALIITATVVLIIAAIAVANQILLGKIYSRDKRESLAEAYATVNGVFTGSSVPENLELEKIYTTLNIAVFIANPEGETVFSSTVENDGRWREDVFRHPVPLREPEIDGEGGASRREPPEPNGSSGEGPFASGEEHDRRWNHAMELHSSFSELKTGEYTIDELSDDRLGSSFLELKGRLSNDYLLYMRTPMTAISEAAATANRLLLFIGAAALVLGLIIIVPVSGAVAKPIRELTGLAKDMSELNFSRRYTGSRRDEIGDLGESVNILSGKLEAAITDLRAANTELERDLELKTAVDRERKAFIANASHELKTPLALISGYAEGLKTVAAEPEQRDFYCDVIVDEAAKMDKIIRQLLRLTEMEAVGTVEKRDIDLSVLVRETVKTVGILAGRKGQSLRLDCDDGIVVTGDETSLEQAVINYLTNAVNHTAEGGEIRVSLENDGDNARFSVFNSGAHIPEEAAEKIWESFYKLDKARTRAYGGSGLGLAIVKRSVALHGGSCGFNNTDGGVEFYFTVPAKKI